MVKSEVIAAVAEQAQLTKKKAAEVVDVVFTTMSDALGNGEKVSIDKFGTFKVKDRAARDCRNPQTGEKIHVEAKKTIGFKATTGILSELNG